MELVEYMEKCEGLRNALHNSKQDAENMILASLLEVFRKGGFSKSGDFDA